MIGQIAYKSAYKYQLQDDYYVTIPIYPGGNIFTDYIDLSVSGMLKVKKGYAWDGPSGPVLDFRSNMRGSLVHDALYQLLRNELLPETDRQVADAVFRDICIEDGISRWRAYTWYYGLRVGGAAAASPEHKKVTVLAPRLYS
jgi:hypothetical protein